MLLKIYSAHLNSQNLSKKYVVVALKYVDFILDCEHLSERYSLAACRTSPLVLFIGMQNTNMLFSILLVDAVLLFAVQGLSSFRKCGAVLLDQFIWF